MEKLGNNLKTLLADSYILMLKTHNFHWNVTGPHFAALHIMFEEQYTELFAAVDLIAERIRALKQYPPGSYSEFTSLSKISDSTQKEWKEMIKELVHSHNQAVHTAKLVIEDSHRLNDDVSADLAVRRIEVHEKYIWMLESLLK